MEASSAPSASVLRFGVFELDVRSGDLRRSGVRVHLQEQPLKLLQCLLERPGEVVTRDELRRRLWPNDTFVDFDHGVNAAVKRLREALADSADTQRFIETLPKRGYRFIAPVVRPDADRLTPADTHPAISGSVANAQTTVDAETSQAGASRWHRWLVPAGAIALVAALATLAAWLRPPVAADPAPSMHMRPLTTLTGSESGPTFSPDGTQVAFAWDGEQRDNSDIYVKLVGSTEVRRLTTDPATDFAPQWSPDGKWIAYARSQSLTAHRIRLMSSLGGSDRGLGDFPLRPPATWSPDGRYLVAGRASADGAAGQGIGLYLVPVDVGEPRQLTQVAAQEQHESPALSPNGRHLAYASCRRTNCYVQLLDLDETYAPAGPPRRLSRQPSWTIKGLAWSRDGRFVIYSARQGAFFHLWRVAIDGEHPPARIEVAGIEASDPAIAAAADRLVFSKSIDDVDLYRLEVGGEAQPIARSSVHESLPQFSPDGRRIAFCSARSGDAFEVWVAGSDGSNPERLTRGPGQWQCSPTWSPDGRRIAFDSQAEDGSWHVWTIDAEGGTPQPITRDAGSQFRPTWSRNGDWIYFVWQRDKDQDIWRTRGPGQPHQRVTFNGAGTRAMESPDGTGVYYKRRERWWESPLVFQPLSGGAPRELSPCVSGSRYAIGRHGIYYVPCSHGRVMREIPVHVLDPATGEDRRFASLKDLPFPETWPRGERSRFHPTAGPFSTLRLSAVEPT